MAIEAVDYSKINPHPELLEKFAQIPLYTLGWNTIELAPHKGDLDPENRDVRSTRLIIIEHNDIRYSMSFSAIGSKPKKIDVLGLKYENGTNEPPLRHRYVVPKVGEVVRHGSEEPVLHSELAELRILMAKTNLAVVSPNVLMMYAKK